jgi:MFS family permease
MFAILKTKWLFFLFVALFTLHITPAIYVNSNFLSQFFSNTQVSLFYTLINICVVIAVLNLRSKLRKYGNYKVFYRVLILELLALILLIFTESPTLIIIAFIALFISYNISFVCIDIFLEKNTKNELTGNVRGIFLTAINASFILGPFISSILLSNGDFKNVYIFMLFLIFPILFLAGELFKDFKDESYDKIKIITGFKKIRKNTDIYSTIMSSFILQFFYAWMVIYIPMYLLQVVGFSLSQITLIIAIALVPFVLLQGITGKLADTRYGEKEMMIIGFITLSFFTALLSFSESTNISVWIALLFMTRVGASMVEITTETHLFKRIDSGDINVISIYRILTPAAYITGTIIGSLFLSIISFNMLFLVLSGITLYGLRYAFTITDSK